MKIAIIFSEKDWTASEIALKIQSLAYTNDLDCYISPKHISRDDHKVATVLKKCQYVIFIAHDINNPDPLTKKELELVKDKYILGIVMSSFKFNFQFSQTFVYSSKQDAIRYIKEQLEKIKHKNVKGKKHKESDTVLILGLTALLIILLIGLGGSKIKRP
jgi:hypothetical protein